MYQYGFLFLFSFILGWVFSLFIFARSVVSIWDDFVSRAYVTMSIDSFVFSSRGQGTTDISWVQIRDATTKHLNVDMAFPPEKKNYTSPNLANLRLRNPHLQWKWSPPWDRKVDLNVPTKAESESAQQPCFAMSTFVRISHKFKYLEQGSIQADFRIIYFLIIKQSELNTYTPANRNTENGLMNTALRFFSEVSYTPHRPCT